MKGLRIGPKLISGFAICVILSAIIGAVAIVQLARIKKDTIEIKIAEDIEKEILECRRQEKNIMLFGPYERAALGEEKEKTYLEKVNDSLIALRKLVVEGKKIAEEEFNAILIEIESYEDSLKKVEADYKEREEIIQNLEASLRGIQEAIQSQTVPIEILQFISKAHEQLDHYLIYYSSEYIARVKNEIMALKKVAEDENTIKFADEFLILFNHLVKNTEILDNHILSMRKNAREIHRITSKITGIAEKRIDVAHRTAKSVVWLTLIFAVVFGSGVGIFLSRNITNPIRKLSATTELIAKGDLTQRVDIKSAGEIGDLAQSFNKMTGDLKTSRDELLSAKDYTDNIIKSMIDTLIVVDPDARIKTINKATSDLLGYKEDELIGKSVATIFAEEDSIFKGTGLKELIEKGSIKDYDLTYKTKDGEKIPVSFSGSVMRDKEGELVGIVGIARDMREIKRLMQKEKEFAVAAAAAAAERKRAGELQKAYGEIQQKTKALEKAKEEIESFSKGLEEKVRERTMELSVLYDISNAISYTLDYQTLLRLIMESLLKIVDYDVCASLLFDTHNANITLKPVYAQSAGFLEEVKNSLIAATSLLVGDNIREKQISVLLIPSAPDIKAKEDRKFSELRSFSNVPFMVRGRIIGMVNVSSCKDDAFTEENVKLMYTIVGQASNAIERLQAVITAEKSKMESMVESMFEGVIMTDEGGEIVVMNPQARRMFGFGLNEEVTSKTLNEKLKVVGLDKALQECHDKKRLITKEIIIHEEENQILHCDITPVKAVEGEIIGIVTILRDITKEKEIDMIKTEFISTVSHELRTPLVGIGGVINNILQGVSGNISDKVRDYLRMADNDIRRLDRLICDLLDYSRIEKGKLKLSKNKNDIINLLENVLTTFMPQIKSKRIILTTHFFKSPLFYYVDGDKITQVFTNLIHNAVKFTPEGGNIHIDIKYIAEKRMLEITVADSGEGIAPENIPKLFKRFVQINRKDGAGAKGTGLGLAICKGIIDAHGGTIRAESEPGRGSKFIFTIPEPEERKVFEESLEENI